MSGRPESTGQRLATVQALDVQSLDAERVMEKAEKVLPEWAVGCLTSPASQRRTPESPDSRLIPPCPHSVLCHPQACSCLLIPSARTLQGRGAVSTL